MSRRFSQVVVVALVGVLLLLSGLLYPATVPHTLHHAHHQAATHATALCSWLCAAGQVVESALPVLRAEFLLVASENPQILLSPSIPSSYRSLSRAPPALLS